MTTATKNQKTHKPAKKPARRVHLHNANSVPMLVELTVGVESFDYFVKRIRADWGMGFEFIKLVHGEPSGEPYHVHYDPARRLSTCDCLGGLQHGHCKHQEAIVALIQSGKLAVPAPKLPEAPKPEPKPQPHRCGICSCEQCTCVLERLHPCEVMNMRPGAVAYVNGHRIEKLQSGLLIDERRVHDGKTALACLASAEKCKPLPPAPVEWDDL